MLRRERSAKGHLQAASAFAMTARETAVMIMPACFLSIDQSNLPLGWNSNPVKLLCSKLRSNSARKPQFILNERDLVLRK